MKRYRQLILVVRETSTSYTAACLLDYEPRESIRAGLLRLCLERRLLACPPPPPVIRVDPAPGFWSLSNDATLRQYGFAVEVGRVKNPNKNPVAEKCVAELGDELFRISPEGGPISLLSLAVASATLNTRIRNRGLSSREMWFQRDQFTNSQIPLSYLQLIRQQVVTTRPVKVLKLLASVPACPLLHRSTIWFTLLLMSPRPVPMIDILWFLPMVRGATYGSLPVPSCVLRPTALSFLSVIVLLAE